MTLTSQLPPLTSGPVTVGGFQRTVVLLEYHSRYGQHVFLRGGISHERRPRKHRTLVYSVTKCGDVLGDERHISKLLLTTIFTHWI